MAENENKCATTLSDLISIAEAEGWKAQLEDYNNGVQYLELHKFSPWGQDFQVELRIETEAWKTPAEVAADELKERVTTFDSSYETFLWLDNTGHGKNGAPYEMIDIYHDMVACKKMMTELLAEWKKAL